MKRKRSREPESSSKRPRRVLAPPCGLPAELWLDEIVGRHLARYRVTVPAVLRETCHWWADALAPSVPTQYTYTEEMVAWRTEVAVPPPRRLWIREDVYDWWYLCPECGRGLRDILDAMPPIYTCADGHQWYNPRISHVDDK